MTSFNTRSLLPAVIADANREKNDYKSYGRPGPICGPRPLFGQQYKFDVREARKIVAGIEARGWFQDPMLSQAPSTNLRGLILNDLHELQTFEGAKQSKGGVKLTRAAAKVLTEYAAELGVDLTFKSGQPRPLHPVG